MSALLRAIMTAQGSIIIIMIIRAIMTAQGKGLQSGHSLYIRHTPRRAIGDRPCHMPCPVGHSLSHGAWPIACAMADSMAYGLQHGLRNYSTGPLP